MARWKLVTSHYLNCVEETKWEYKEVDRATGRERRKQLTVPRFIDINDPGDWTTSWGPRDALEGEVIVCLPGKGQPKDIEFLGDPTPDMIPLDDEAKELSATFEDHWRYKPESADISFSQSMVEGFNAEQAEIQSRPTIVEVPGMAEMVAAVASLAAQNTELMKELTRRKL